jgi:hypothetical protein
LTHPGALCETPAYMRYRGKIEFAHERKIRERNTSRYRAAHWPIWIFVFFLAPGPLTFSLFAHGFNRFNAVWLVLVLIGTGIACYKAQLPGSELRPYILRFDEDKPNPLYRRVCYTFAWNAILNFALMNLIGLDDSRHQWPLVHERLFITTSYLPVCALILILGVSPGCCPELCAPPRVRASERRYFYGSQSGLSPPRRPILLDSLEDAAAEPQPPTGPNWRYILPCWAFLAIWPFTESCRALARLSPVN